jgi:hypothetical protein
MAKKKGNFDVNSTLESIIGAGVSPRTEESAAEVAEATAEPTKNPTALPQTEDSKAIKIHKSYYLTEEIVKAVALKSALSGMDKSEIVRAALTAYLQPEIDFLQGS